MNAEILGFGPEFQLLVSIENLSATHVLADTFLSATGNGRIWEWSPGIFFAEGEDDLTY